MEDNRQTVTATTKDSSGAADISGTCKIWHLVFPYHDKNPEFGIEPSEFLSFSPEKRVEHILNGFATKAAVEAVAVSYCVSDFPEEGVDEGPMSVGGKYGYHHFHVLVKYRTPSDADAVKNCIGNNPHLSAVRQPKGQQDRSTYKAFLQNRVDYVLKKGKFEGREHVVAFRVKGQFVKPSKTQERADIVKEMKADGSASIAAALIEHPEHDNPASKAFFRANIIAEKYREAGYPSSRPVSLVYVTGKVLSGKTTAIHIALKGAGVRFFTLGDENGIEEYAGEDALIVDDPIPAACPENMLTKMVGNTVLKLDVRYGLVPTLWHHVIIESSLPLDELSRAYGGHRVYDKLVGHVREYWYCFAVTTDDKRLTCRDGYLNRQEDGYWIRYECLRIPVSRHFQPGSHTIRMMAKMYFSLTHVTGETAEDFDDIVFSEGEKHILRQLWEYSRQGIPVTSSNFTALYREAIAERLDGNAHEIASISKLVPTCS